MRKIIGFKLNLRLKEVQRRAKKAKLDWQAAGVDEAALDHLLEQTSRSLVPGVLFDTFPKADPDQSQLSSMPGLAYSLVLTTLGNGLDSLKEKSLQENQSLAPLWPIIEETALDEAARFATALLEDEAAKESCELSPITPLSDPAVLETAVKKLDVSKIGVGLSDGRLTPAATVALSLSWLSKSKTKGKAKS